MGGVEAVTRRRSVAKVLLKAVWSLEGILSWMVKRMSEGLIGVKWKWMRLWVQASLVRSG